MYKSNKSKREVVDLEVEILRNIVSTYHSKDKIMKNNLIDYLIYWFGSDKYNHDNDDPIKNPIEMIKKTKKLFKIKKDDLIYKANYNSSIAQIEASHSLPSSYTFNSPYAYGIRTKKRKKTKGKQTKGKKSRGKQTKGKKIKGKQTKGKQTKEKQTKGKKRR